MTITGTNLSNEFLLSLHKELLLAFSKHYEVEIKTLTVFQLYGFGNYDEKIPSLRKFIIDKTGKWINGKYLYNKIKEIDKGHNKHIKLNREYLLALVNCIGYKNYEDYLKNSPYLSAETKQFEETNYNSFATEDEKLYYIGYYVEDREYYVKSKFTIYKMKTASWEILSWEKEFEPTFYTYYGKCVFMGDSVLSFYFSKENSNLNRECFVNLFFGNNTITKPILLGSYCGFSKHDNPVVGKLIFELVDTLELQDEKVRNNDINPDFYYYLYSQRLEVERILPQKISDLSIPSSRAKIIKFLMGDYTGFFMDQNNYLVSISFQILNKLGEIKLKINNKTFKGIARISNTENYLIAEFTEKNNSYSQFSIQVKPLEKGLFLGNSLIYIGADTLNNKVLLWKENSELKEFVSKNKDFYIDPDSLEISVIEKLKKYLILI